MVIGVGAMTLRLLGTVGRGDFHREVDLSLEPGMTLAIVGPNGAGKSTIIHTVAGLIALVAGQLSIDGVVWDDPSSHLWVEPEHRDCAVAFQDLRLFPHLTVLRNVEYGLRARKSPRGVIDERAREALTTVGALHLASRSPDDLSGGERQRVALARAIATKPKVLLLDEPLSAVDSDSKAVLRGLLPELVGGLGAMTLMVSHDPDDVRAIATETVTL